jgi:hypothetical protein
VLEVASARLVLVYSLVAVARVYLLAVAVQEYFGPLPRQLYFLR